MELAKHAKIDGIYVNDECLAAFVGRTLMKIEGAEPGSEEVDLYFTDGTMYRMFHSQGCCEHVELNDVTGDIDDLIGSPITMAEEVSNSEGPRPDEWSDSFTWTFYNFATSKGYVTLRWLGESNGYYSEEVDIRRVR